MPPIIGLTGGIACGKSHLSAALKAHGATVIDADEISRSLTAPGGPALPKIRERFGDLRGTLPVTESVAQRTIALPFHSNLTEAQVDTVVTALTKSL